MMDIDSFVSDILRVAPELRGATFAPLGEGMDGRALFGWSYPSPA